MSKRKSPSRAKLKAASQEEQIHTWQEHFKNLLGKFPKVTDQPIMKIIDNQLDIKLRQFAQEELDVVLKKIKNRKVARLNEISPEVWKTRKFKDILFRYCNAIYDQNTIERWTKGGIFPLLKKKNDIRIAKNYHGIILTSISAKIYNVLLLNLIEPEIVKILKKNQNGFWRNRSTTTQILTIRLIIEGV